MSPRVYSSGWSGAGLYVYVTTYDSPQALAHARDQCRWLGGMVGNHVADPVEKYGEHSGMVPEELTS